MGSIQELFSNMIRIITFVGGGLAVVYMLYGFVRYSMASGNPQAADAAKSTIAQAAIGLVGIGGIALLLNVLVQVLPGGAGQNIAGILPDTSMSGSIPRVASVGGATAVAGTAGTAGKWIVLTFDSPIKVEGNPTGLQILITRTNGQQFLVSLKGCGASGLLLAANCSPDTGITTLVFGEITTAAGSTQCADTAAGCTVQRFQFNGVPVRSIAGNANIDPTIPAHTALVGG